MITARNYAAQAERFLSNNGYNGIANKIKKAIHFSLPDGGRVFDDKCKGIKDTLIRLPYPKCTIEFYSPDHKAKCVLLAEEISSEEILSKYYKIVEFDIGIRITPILFFEGKWIFMGTSGIVPTNWDNKEGATLVNPNNIDFNGKFQCQLMALDGDYILSAKETSELDVAVRSGYVSDAQNVLELIEALSCSNVTHEPIEKINPAVNARRIRDGKLPLYETRCLVINAGKSVAAGDGIGGTHGSPRQHLRRGHIRRHPTAGNIWVNSCVVGSADIGVIDKQYAVM